MSEETLSNLSREERRFEPPAEIAENANVKADAYERAAADRLGFWAEQAERLDWDQKWDRVLDWDNPPFAKWFVGGTHQRGVQLRGPARRGRRTATGWPSTGSASRRTTPATSPTPSSRTRSARRPTR